MTATIWIDGVAAKALPLPDRGLDYGDGLFETILVLDRYPVLLELHLQRLQSGAERLGFPPCLDKAAGDLRQVLDALPAKGVLALRLTLERGQGPRGYTPPLQPEPRSIITVTSLASSPDVPLPPLAVVPVGMRLGQQPALAGIKHLNRLEQVLAMRESAAQGADEALMCDQAGAVVSLAAANLYAVHEGVISTPAIEDCGVAGTRRRALLERWAPALGLRVLEQPLSLDTLLAADEVFCSNSLVGLRAVASIGERHWSAQPVMSRLYQEYLKELPR